MEKIRNILRPIVGVAALIAGIIILANGYNWVRGLVLLAAGVTLLVAFVLALRRRG
ncbi:hypothetical protein FACS189499_09290 [Clostridia bacterium]|nr:hypothetical protein FACS189499_09290 [Clostridia bacterium]